MTEVPCSRALSDAVRLENVAEGRYRVDLSPWYTVVGRPNGGYLQCVMSAAGIDAARQAGSPHQHTTAITTNYVGAPEIGPAEIVVDVRRVGRGATFVHTELYENDKLTTESLITLGTLHRDSTMRYHDTAPFDLPALDDCTAHHVGPDVNIGRCMELRLDPACTGWWQGQVSDRGEIRGWIRLDDGAASWDEWSLLFASDALPPATFAIGSTGWVPTLQLSSYVRAIPVGEWMKVRQWCVVVEDGLVDERCELFDSRDRLVASSSQLAMVRFPNDG